MNRESRSYLVFEREFGFGTLVLIFLIAALSCGDAKSQWKKIASFSGEHFVPSILEVTFLHNVGAPEVGFVSEYNAGEDYGQVWRTTDHGETWQPMLKTENDYSKIAQFAFKDRNTGWFVANEGFSSKVGGCFMTEDGGKNWRLLKGTEGNCVGVYYHRPTERLIVSRWYIPSLTSGDEGKTWQTFGNGGQNEGQNGVSFLDDSIGVAMPELQTGTWQEGPHYYTTNGGVDWHTSQSIASWEALALPESRTFLAMGRDEELYASTDGGITWAIRAIIPCEGNQFSYVHLVRTNCLIALQSIQYGFSISTDEGYTWHHIGGPANGYSTRFYSWGDTIWAASLGAQLWRNDLSGYAPKHLDVTIDTIATHYSVRVSLPSYLPLGFLLIDSVTFTLTTGDNLTVLDEIVDPKWLLMQKVRLSDDRVRYHMRYRGGTTWLDSNIISFVVRPNATSLGSSKLTIDDVYYDTLSNFYVECMGSTPPSQTVVNVSLDGCEIEYLTKHMTNERGLVIKSVYPNPTQGSITFDYESKLSGAVMLTVYSLSGVLVHEEVLAATAAGKTVQLDASGWASGAYTIVLKSGEEEAKASVIKN